MDVNKVFEDISALYPLVVKIGKKDADALAQLNRVHKAVFGTTVVAGCSGCHVKAYNKLASLTLEDLLIMENAKFKLKKGVLLNYPFMSGDHYTAQGGIPDAIAAKYLDSKPDKVDQFDLYPGSDKGELDTKAIAEILKGKKAESKPAKTKKADKAKDDEPVETEPVETEPVETEPVETEPVETEPIVKKLNVPKKTLSKMNSAELKAEYFDVLLSNAPEGATNNDLRKAIEKALKK